MNASNQSGRPCVCVVGLLSLDPIRAPLCLLLHYNDMDHLFCFVLFHFFVILMYHADEIISLGKKRR